MHAIDGHLRLTIAVTPTPSYPGVPIMLSESLSRVIFEGTTHTRDAYSALVRNDLVEWARQALIIAKISERLDTCLHFQANRVTLPG